MTSRTSKARPASTYRAARRNQAKGWVWHPSQPPSRRSTDPPIRRYDAVQVRPSKVYGYDGKRSRLRAAKSMEAARDEGGSPLLR